MYNQLFWGLFFVIFDLRIQNLDILPAFIGFIMIATALGKLSDQNVCFKNAKPFASAMVPLSFMTLFQASGINISINPSSIWDWMTLLLGQLYSILELFLLGWMLRGIKEEAKLQNLPGLEQHSKSAWKFYASLSIILLMLTPFFLNVPDQWAGGLIFLSFVKFIALISVLVLLRHMKKLLNR